MLGGSSLSAEGLAEALRELDGQLVLAPRDTSLLVRRASILVEMGNSQVCAPFLAEPRTL